MKPVKLLFSSDLHGSTLCFQKLLSVALANDVNALLIGGDISGKTLTPVVDRGNGKFEAAVLGSTRTAKADRELREMEEDIANSGSYPIRVSPEEFLQLERDEAFRNKRFIEAMSKRLERWLWLAEQKLRPKMIRLLVICGNDDDWVLDDIIRQSPIAENPDREKLELLGYEVIGESTANLTPFGCPRDVPDDHLGKRVQRKIATLSDLRRSIFLFHAPPYNSGLDNAYKLDKEKRIVTQGGQPVLEAVGSKAVLGAICDHQPLLSLHGHIHESPKFAHIGRTLSVNVGSEFWTGTMHSALISLDSTRVAGHMFINY